jgi:hypothetical protein
MKRCEAAVKLYLLFGNALPGSGSAANPRDGIFPWTAIGKVNTAMRIMSIQNVLKHSIHLFSTLKNIARAFQEPI